MVTLSAAPPPKWPGNPPPFCGVGCGGVDWESLLPCGVGSGGWESPSLLLPLWCGVWWVGIPLPPPCGVGFGGVEFVLGSLGGLVVVVKLL